MFVYLTSIYTHTHTHTQKKKKKEKKNSQKKIFLNFFCV